MQKYDTADRTTLQGRIHLENNQEDAEILKTLIRSSSWPKIYKTATDERTFTMVTTDKKTYYDVFMAIDTNQENLQEPQKKLTLQQTTQLMEDWTKEQGIDLLEFQLKIYAIIKQTHPPKNTLYLQGQSNAGKTYITNSLIPNKDKIGSHISSKEFPFMECVNKNLILINELTIKDQAEAELYKNILGGEATFVNIKNKPGELLYRKPVIITSNELLWRYITNERLAFLNRMFPYLHLKESTQIKKYTPHGIPTPRYWQLLVY